ncbi:MAG: thioredoxin family protein [Candidatus Methylomirabilales bacterium]
MGRNRKTTLGTPMSSNKLVQVSDADFDQKVVKSPGLTIVDVWAEWGAPCRMIAPVLQELAYE